MKTNWFLRMVIVVFLSISLLPAPQPAQAQIPVHFITVNDDGDAGDFNIGDGICDAYSGVPGSQCTLRAAIQEANAFGGASFRTEILFDGNYTFTPAAAYPALDNIEASHYTYIKAMANNIIIDGSGVPAGFSCFRLITDNHRIQGLTIKNFTRGILVESNGNHIGTDGNGTNDAQEGNTIINSDWEGILVSGNNNHIAGNYIGIDNFSTLGLGNIMDGIMVEGDNNIIGVDGSNDSYNASERNVISNNGSDGIVVRKTGVLGHVIAGNYIGTSAGGSLDRGNAGHGIWISEITPGDISAPIRIGTNGDGIADLQERNIISGNGSNGILAQDGSSGMTIRGNYIGTTVTGSSALPNGGNGVQLQESAIYVYIGTDGDGVQDDIEGNLISGNGNAGINIQTSDNYIAGNKIGTNANGNAAIPNGFHGIILSGAYNNVGVAYNHHVGALWEGNIISGNDSCGVYVLGEDSDYNNIAGNLIGLNAAGDAAIPNTTNGICIQSGADYTDIGKDGPDDELERNVISGNAQNGIYIVTGSDSTNTNIRSNYIGTTSVWGDVPNGADGIRLFDGTGTYIHDNVIGFNGSDGIDLRNSDSNIIASNYLGVSPDGDALPNGTNGIYIGTAKDGKATETNSFSFNSIAYNAGSGIYLDSAAGPGHYLSYNMIYLNGGLGIDLAPAGVTPNDALDADSGANDLLNYPEFSSVELLDPAAGTIRFNGTFNSLPNYTFYIHIYASRACDASGYGEGQVYVGQFTTGTDGNGDVNITNRDFTFTSWLTYPYFTAVAVDSVNWSTSEFSACVELPLERVYLPMLSN